MVGVLYGPLAFFATIGSTIGLLALYLQRRVGKSIQFGDSSITRSLIAQLIGLAIAVGVLVFLVSLNKLPLP